MRTKDVEYVHGNGDVHTKIRLYADDGKVLTNDNGKTVWNCIDVDSADGWVEIDAPEEEELSEDDATVEDYEDALKEVGIIEEG